MQPVIGTLLEGSNFDDLVMQAHDAEENLRNSDPEKLEPIMYKLSLMGRVSTSALERAQIQEKLNFYGRIYASITNEYFNAAIYEQKLMSEREYIVEQTGFGD